MHPGLGLLQFHGSVLWFVKIPGECPIVWYNSRRVFCMVYYNSTGVFYGLLQFQGSVLYGLLQFQRSVLWCVTIPGECSMV